MRKAFLVFGILLPSLGFGQTVKQVVRRGIRFDFVGTDSRFMVRQPMVFSARDTAVWEALTWSNAHNNVYKGAVPKSPILLGAHLGPNVGEVYEVAVKSISKDYSGYRIQDSSDATLIAMGITTENVTDYQYHVVEDDSIELIPWSPVRTLEQHFGAKRPYAFLGTYNVPGHRIMIEVVHKKKYSIRDGVIFDFRRDVRPIITEMDVIVKPYRYWNLHSDKGSPYATRFDSATGLPLNLTVPVDTVDQFTLKFAPHETVPYIIYLIGEKDTTTLSMWYRGDEYDLDSRYFNKPGKYALVVWPVGDYGYWNITQTIHLTFEVIPTPMLQHTVTLQKILWYALSALALIVVGFTLYYTRNRTRLHRFAQDRQLAGLQLKAIRSQLNPHFMFNALSSIQNLMNRNDLPGANRYLSTFAGLTRKVLFAGDQELISLSDEAGILEDYLQMEQLRFGFQYSVEMDPAIDKTNVDIPTMLLQPFVENAVKHGVNALHENGVIVVSIKKAGNDLHLTVTDNGKGVEPAAQPHFGLKLGEERIALLNQINRDKQASLTIQTGAQGTTISIILAAWL